MKASDAIARWLRYHGIRHVYLVSGGGNLHLIKSLADCDGINYVPMQHECEAGFAADATARLTGIGCALSTSGPGATNMITAVASSWFDSVSCLYLTGNVTRARMSGDSGVRQTGFQETDICKIVEPVTKFCETVMMPERVLPALNEAHIAMMSGRRGPALIDLPDDIQRAEITC